LIAATTGVEAREPKTRPLLPPRSPSTATRALAAHRCWRRRPGSAGSRARVPARRPRRPAGRGRPWAAHQHAPARRSGLGGLRSEIGRRFTKWLPREFVRGWQIRSRLFSRMRARVRPPRGRLRLVRSEREVGARETPARCAHSGSALAGRAGRQPNAQEQAGRSLNDEDQHALIRPPTDDISTHPPPAHAGTTCSGVAPRVRPRPRAAGRRCSPCDCRGSRSRSR
jgi:hypothetical protein